MKTTQLSPRIQSAIDHIDGIVTENGVVYYDHPTQKFYFCDDPEEMETLASLIETQPADAYSLWCADTSHPVCNKAGEIIEALTAFLNHVESAFSNVSYHTGKPSHEDGQVGGWVNVQATLADGTGIPYGYWLHAGGESNPDDSSIYDTVRRDGYALEAYWGSEITDGSFLISGEMQRLWDAAIEEDGNGRITCDEIVSDHDSLDEFLAEYCQNKLDAEAEGEEAWLEELRRKAAAITTAMEIPELLKLLIVNDDA